MNYLIIKLLCYTHVKSDRMLVINVYRCFKSLAQNPARKKKLGYTSTEWGSCDNRNYIMFIFVPPDISNQTQFS